MPKPANPISKTGVETSLDEPPALLAHAGVTLPETVDHHYLVDLIDQPAWKTILLEIVRQEKMDPWDIDVGHLADRYLAKINALSQANLRVPANAMLACAILLKHKAKSLRLTSIEDELESEMQKGLTPEERALLVSQIPELRNARPMREGKVTLDELVQTIEVLLHKSQSTGKLYRNLVPPNFVVPFSEIDIEQKMNEVLALIRQKADSQGLVLFSHLANGAVTSNEIINLFIPLLFLANNGQVGLWQDEFWGEIFIRLETPKSI